MRISDWSSDVCASDLDIRDALTKAGLAGSSARFFINGIDTRTQGLDVVASYRLPDMGIGKLTLTAGYNLNDTKITDRRTFSGFTADRLFARPESPRLTDGQPSNKLNIGLRSEEHTSELQSIMRISYAVF